ATTKGISSTRVAFGCQLASCSTCSSVTLTPSQLRRTDSRTMRIETGSRRMLGYLRARAGSEWNFAVRPDLSLNSLRVLNVLLPMADLGLGDRWIGVDR